MAARTKIHAPKGNLGVIIRNKLAQEINESNNVTGSEYTSHLSNFDLRRNKAPKKTVLEIIGNRTKPLRESQNYILKQMLSTGGKNSSQNSNFLGSQSTLPIQNHQQFVQPPDLQQNTTICSKDKLEQINVGPPLYSPQDKTRSNYKQTFGTQILEKAQRTYGGPGVQNLEEIGVNIKGYNFSQNQHSKNLNFQNTTSTNQNLMQPVLKSDDGTEKDEYENFEPSFLTGLKDENGAFQLTEVSNTAAKQPQESVQLLSILPSMAPGNTLIKSSPKSPTFDPTFLTVPPMNLSMISDSEVADVTTRRKTKTSMLTTSSKSRINKYDFSTDNVRKQANFDSALDILEKKRKNGLLQSGLVPLNNNCAEQTDKNRTKMTLLTTLLGGANPESMEILNQFNRMIQVNPGEIDIEKLRDQSYYFKNKIEPPRDIYKSLITLGRKHQKHISEIEDQLNPVVVTDELKGDSLIEQTVEPIMSLTNCSEHLESKIGSTLLKSDSQDQMQAIKDLESTLMLPPVTKREVELIPLPKRETEFSKSLMKNKDGDKTDFYDSRRGSALQAARSKIGLPSYRDHGGARSNELLSAKQMSAGVGKSPFQRSNRAILPWSSSNADMESKKISSIDSKSNDPNSSIRLLNAKRNYSLIFKNKNRAPSENVKKNTFKHSNLGDYLGKESQYLKQIEEKVKWKNMTPSQRTGAMYAAMQNQNKPKQKKEEPKQKSKVITTQSLDQSNISIQAENKSILNQDLKSTLNLPIKFQIPKKQVIDPQSKAPKQINCARSSSMPEGVGTLRGSASNSEYNVTETNVAGSIRQSIPNTSTAAMHKAIFMNNSQLSQRRDTRQLSVQHQRSLLNNSKNASTKNNVIMNRIIKGDLTMFDNAIVQSSFNEGLVSGSENVSQSTKRKLPKSNQIANLGKSSNYLLDYHNNQTNTANQMRYERLIGSGDHGPLLELPSQTEESHIMNTNETPSSTNRHVKIQKVKGTRIFKSPSKELHPESPNTVNRESSADNLDKNEIQNSLLYMDNLATKANMKKIVVQPPAPQRSISPRELELNLSQQPELNSINLESQKSNQLAKTKSNANVQKNKSNFGLQAYRNEVNRERYEQRMLQKNKNRSSHNTAGANNIRVNQTVLEFEGEDAHRQGMQTGQRAANPILARQNAGQKQQPKQSNLDFNSTGQNFIFNDSSISSNPKHNSKKLVPTSKQQKSTIQREPQRANSNNLTSLNIGSEERGDYEVVRRVSTTSNAIKIQKANHQKLLQAKILEKTITSEHSKDSVKQKVKPSIFVEAKKLSTQHQLITDSPEDSPMPVMLPRNSYDSKIQTMNLVYPVSSQNVVSSPTSTFYEQTAHNIPGTTSSHGIQPTVSSRTVVKSSRNLMAFKTNSKSQFQSKSPSDSLVDDSKSNSKEEEQH